MASAPSNHFTVTEAVHIFGWLTNSELASCRLVCKQWKDVIDQHALASIPVTCTAPVNIAVIKYWGKRDEVLILPTNSSLSGTLHQDDLRSETTVQAVRNLKEDEFFLNGEKCSINSKRMQNCLRLLRASAGRLSTSTCFIPPSMWNQYKFRIVSENNFPTAAGLASSASGFCCLVFTLSRLLSLKDDRVFLSSIARQGSGSACRSMYGGFSKWERGEKADGSDSVALPVAPESHWEDMRVIILVANDHKKDVGSTEGMQKSLEGVAGKALQRRAEVTVPRRMKKIETAILEKNFDEFARITMKDSDDFHHVCAITEPPLHYMNATSNLIVRVVNAVNEREKVRVAAYTFDAGPNGVIYLLKQHVPLFLAATLYVFPGKPENHEYLRNISSSDVPPLPVDLQSLLDQVKADAISSDSELKYILGTRLGPGPQQKESKASPPSSFNFGGNSH